MRKVNNLIKNIIVVLLIFILICCVLLYFYKNSDLSNLIKSEENSNKSVSSSIENNSEGSIDYYYTFLNEDEQVLYNAIAEVASEPDQKNSITIELTVNPDSEEGKKEYKRAYLSVIYDHPEYFWFKAGKVDVEGRYYSLKTLKGMYKMDISLDNTYEAYETVENNFDNAVEQFMAQIDLTKSQPSIALQIHDKLIELVTYDHNLADNYDPKSEDYGYTAYGALVANSSGQANTCVCDGYSCAYAYLLKKAGIEAVIVTGNAGNTTDDAMRHSWNAVKFDNDWYEVDVTWDDKELDADNSITQAALEDEEFYGNITHWYFNLTTDAMSNFSTGNNYVYRTYLGSLTLSADTVHIKDTENENVVTCNAPIAYGNTYSYKYLRGW